MCKEVAEMRSLVKNLLPIFLGYKSYKTFGQQSVPANFFPLDPLFQRLLLQRDLQQNCKELNQFLILFC